MTNWQKHEKDVQELLGLSSTVCSGNKFEDPSDGVSNKHHADDKYPLMVDCKATEAKSYRLEEKMLSDWWKTALSFGKIFALPVRFYDGDDESDWIVTKLSDYAELLDQARKNEAPQEKFTRDDKLSRTLNEMWDLATSQGDPKLRFQLLNLVIEIDESIPGESSL